MKITDIRTAIIRIVGPCVWVKIDTDAGITGLAELHQLPFAPHNVSGPIGTVAMAHVCAALPNFLILEFHGLGLAYWEDLVSYAGDRVIQAGAV